MRVKCFFQAPAVIVAVLCVISLGGVSREAFSAPSYGRERREAVPAQQPLTPASFAARITLEGPAGQVLSFTLTEAVHARLQRQDLRDLCVFDSAGVPVPFMVRSPGGGDVRYELKGVSIPFFPWQPAGAASGAAAGTPARTDVEINTSGGIVRIHTQGSAAPKAGPVSILLDMQDFLHASRNPAEQAGVFGPETLRSRSLAVKPSGDAAFLTAVTMQTSADLASWRGIGQRQVLARFRQGDDKAERFALALPEQCDRYLLLRLEGDAPAIESVEGGAVHSKTVSRLDQKAFSGTRSADGRSITYDLGGVFPLREIGFDLPQTDMMAVRVASRSTPKEGWNFFRRGIIYRLEKDGVSIRSEPFALRRSEGLARYWQLSAVGDIPFAAAPDVRAYWNPLELVFLARGQGPWTLAFGRDSAVDAPALPLADLGAATAATVTAQPDSPGHTAKTPFWDQGGTSGQQWMLWAVLGAAVVFLTGLAVYLFRSMSRSDTKK